MSLSQNEGAVTSGIVWAEAQGHEKWQLKVVSPVSGTQAADD
jgi:hypothetical protein